MNEGILKDFDELKEYCADLVKVYNLNELNNIYIEKDTTGFIGIRDKKEPGGFITGIGFWSEDNFFQLRTNISIAVTAYAHAVLTWGRK